MPGRGTPRQAIRIPDELWRRFGTAAQAAGMDRAVLIREFVRWFVRDADARLPQRPER